LFLDAIDSLDDPGLVTSSLSQRSGQAMPSNATDSITANGHDEHHLPPPTISRKVKGKKAMDFSNEASRLLQARISQLEQDATTEKDQELEIGTETPCEDCDEYGA
jgi:hypothetical protein